MESLGLSKPQFSLKGMFIGTGGVACVCLIAKSIGVESIEWLPVLVAICLPMLAWIASIVWRRNARFIAFVISVSTAIVFLGGTAYVASFGVQALYNSGLLLIGLWIPQLILFGSAEFWIWCYREEMAVRDRQARGDMVMAKRL